MWSCSTSRASPKGRWLRPSDVSHCRGNERLAGHLAQDRVRQQAVQTSRCPGAAVDPFLPQASVRDLGHSGRIRPSLPWSLLGDHGDGSCTAALPIDDRLSHSSLPGLSRCVQTEGRCTKPTTLPPLLRSAATRRAPKTASSHLTALIKRVQGPASRSRRCMARHFERRAGRA